MRLIVFSIVTLVLSAGLLAEAVEVPQAPDFLTAEQRSPLQVFAASLESNIAQYGEHVGEINGKYMAALDRARAKMVKLGAARAAVALDSEIDRIEAGEIERSPEIDSAPDYVRKMRDQYDQLVGRVNNLKRSRDGAARFAVVDSFGTLQAELTKAEELEKAMVLREFRRLLARPPAPPKELEPEPEPKLDSKSDPESRVEGVRMEARYGIDDVPRAITAEERKKFAASLPPEPERSGRRYLVMVESIEKGEVITEISLNKIESWGNARLQMWRRKPYWTATVSYPTTSLFGTFDTEGMAILSGDRVVEWVYTGSGEEIP